MKKRKRDASNLFLELLELRLAIIGHCQALRAVVRLLSEDKVTVAIARLDGAVTALWALVRAHCAGQKMKCPNCGSEQEVVTWVDEGKCGLCDAELENLTGE